MAYDIKFRKQVLSHMERENLRAEEVAQLFGVAASTIRRWLKNLHPKALNRKPWKLDMEQLKKDLEEYPDAYQYERAARLGVGQNCIFHGLKRLKISYKKNLHSSQSGRRKAYYLSKKD